MSYKITFSSSPEASPLMRYYKSAPHPVPICIAPMAVNLPTIFSQPHDISIGLIVAQPNQSAEREA